MALIASRSSVTRCTRQQRPSMSRKLAVAPKAFNMQELTSSIANDFVRIFSKPESNVETFAENNFRGKINHHNVPRKPFADGFAAQLKPSQSVERTEADAEDYLRGAVNRVANHHFKGDSTEPKSFGMNDGFTGDIHGRGAQRDGFHTKSR